MCQSRHPDRVLSRKARKCLDCQLINLCFLHFVNNNSFISTVSSFVSSRSFLHDVRSCHQRTFGLGKQILQILMQNSTFLLFG